jgi:hypothetical protein
LKHLTSGGSAAESCETWKSAIIQLFNTTYLQIKSNRRNKMNKFNFIQIYADKVEVDTQDQSVVLSGVDPAQVVAEFGVQTILEEIELSDIMDFVDEQMKELKENYEDEKANRQ